MRCLFAHSPDINAVSFPLRCKHLHRHLVGVDNLSSEEGLAQGIT